MRFFAFLGMAFEEKNRHLCRRHLEPAGKESEQGLSDQRAQAGTGDPACR